MKNKVLETFSTNKSDILEHMRRNDHFSPYMENAIQIIEDMNLPDLIKLFDFDNNPNEGLVYNFVDNQEHYLPHIGICLERISNFSSDFFGWEYHTVYSIPIVIIPMYDDLSDLKTDDIKDMDVDGDLGINCIAFNHYYGF